MKHDGSSIHAVRPSLHSWNDIRSAHMVASAEADSATSLGAQRHPHEDKVMTISQVVLLSSKGPVPDGIGLFRNLMRLGCKIPVLFRKGASFRRCLRERAPARCLAF